MVVVFLSNAKTIHWIIASDVEDVNIGTLNATGRDALICHFINPIAIVADSLGYNSIIYQNDSTNFTPRDVITTINNINSADDDILVLYYLGHGYASAKEKEFPILVFNPEEFGQIDLDYLNQNLAKKAHKAVLSIAIASNRELTHIAKSSIPIDSMSYNKGFIPQHLTKIRGCYLSDTEFCNIEKGIKQVKGELCVVSAKRGYDSFGGDTPFGAMDFYTYAFIRCFEDKIFDADFSWLDVFCDVSDVIKDATGGKQKPFLQLTISKNN